MTEDKPIWIGKGPITYNVSIHDGHMAEFTPIPDDEVGAGWKYHLYISGAGKYEDAPLSPSGDSDMFLFLADTEEGVIRDLAMFIARQNTELSKKERADYGFPPQPLNLNNVEIFDYTIAEKFHDIDIPAIFANVQKLADNPAPPGERQFIASIRDVYDLKKVGNHEEEVKVPNHYNIGLSVMDPLVYEEFENWGQWDIEYKELSNVPGKDVNQAIRNKLSKMQYWGEGDLTLIPNINNTKILNYTSNPAFTLNNIFAIKSPQLTHKHASLQLTKKVPAAKPYIKILPKKEKAALESAKEEAEKQRKKLHA